MSFESVYSHGFARVASCTIPVAIADPATNAEAVITEARACHEEGVALAVFPELSLTGYAIDDLFLQDAVLEATSAALSAIARASADLLPVIVVGAPLRWRHRLYNCAVLIHRGEILGVVPKQMMPTYREFYEARHFASGAGIRGQWITVGAPTRPGRGGPDEDFGPLEVPFGVDLLTEAIDIPGLTIHVEICEDMWVPVPPSAEAALAGATVLVNLSGSPITVGRAAERHLLAKSASSRCLAAYLYAAAGQGESSNDLSWDGQTMIYENGVLLAETDRFPDGPRRSVADIDLDLLRQERQRMGTFDDNARSVEQHQHPRGDTTSEGHYRRLMIEVEPPVADIGLRRAVDRFPFVPNSEAQLDQDCYEAFAIQVTALAQRMQAIGEPKLVIGVSGGLDSTHALLVAVRAMDRLGRPRSDILGFTLPGFATGERTRSNAHALGKTLGISFEEIDIRPAAEEMLTQIGHPFAGGEPVYDVTFENVQAGLRTDYLFRLANDRGGIVVGTGDLSEMALGWCTYGVGDQMSHYAVNTGVPKTLIQHLVRWVISSGEVDENAAEVLRDVLDTRITPELVPAGEDEEVQSTEDAIGPYSLHDFTLYYVLRFGFRPAKIAFLAHHAWREAESGSWPPGFPEEGRYTYELSTIVKWERVFLDRFFGFSQFKRSAIPNGPKVMAGGALSPRGEWRAPSDGTARVWLRELDALADELGLEDATDGDGVPQTDDAGRDVGAS